MPVGSITWGSRDEPNDAMDIPADHEAHSSILQPELNSCAEFTTAGMDNEEPVDVADAADAADADLFEMMSCGQDLARNDHDNPMPSLSEVPATSNHTGLPAVGLQTVPTVTVERFPIETAGIPIIGRPGDMPIYESTQTDLGDNIWAPFHSQCDWEIAHWAKLRGPTSSAVAIYSAFQRTARDFVTFYHRDIIMCIRALYGEPEYAQHLAFAPERHYTDETRSCRIYNELHTGDWWWTVQASLEQQRPGATIIPIIISSDKTQLTLFRGKSAYPVYLTLGNIPKTIRRKPSCRAQMLIGYIPITGLDHMKNQAARRHALTNLFHGCMSHFLAPIGPYGKTGIAMMSGDGVWRRCHPIFAIFVGDYPEQCLVTCTYQGRCPKCNVSPSELGENASFTPRDLKSALNAYMLADGDATTFHAACRNAGLKPVYHPFWETLPHTDIFRSITPDILHQLLQGVMKHLLAWVTSPTALGAEEINARCQRLPLNHNVHLFSHGITCLSRVSGKEHKDICRILLGLVIELPLPNGQSSSRLVRAVRALLDFLYLAQFPTHTTATLVHLADALTRFHENKEIFIDLGTCKQFNFPKLHSLLHYQMSITLFGTTDSYDTEQTERLHIDFTKDAY
ncbi:hypothetical protein BJV78DRAFT_1283211 [Lactifluus subvellereus]|nr:hypothetical protein BJV78DRAFT_1283211 [Lactifluus subvellereus]